MIYGAFAFLKGIIIDRGYMLGLAAAAVFMLSSWKTSIEQGAASKVINQVQEANRNAPKAGHRAAANSGKPASRGVCPAWIEGC